MPLAFSQACENNKEPILAVLKPLFADKSSVLEIGSGTGQHAVYFSQAMPHLTWQPSDRPDYFDDLSLRCEQAQLNNLLHPIHFDVTNPWQLSPVDAVFTANTLHIMSWQEAIQFIHSAGNFLQPGGLLCAYGPFNYKGAYTSDSNAQFDAWLKRRDPLSGIRHFETLCEHALQSSLHLVDDHPMPANNRCLVWQKKP